MIPDHLRGSVADLCRLTTSSIHLLEGCDPVCWELPHQKGPYGGNDSSLVKSFTWQIQGDSVSDFNYLYNMIRTQLQASGYHGELLPAIDCLRPECNIAQCPVDFMQFDYTHEKIPTWTDPTALLSAHTKLSCNIY